MLILILDSQDPSELVDVHAVIVKIILWRLIYHVLLNPSAVTVKIVKVEQEKKDRGT